MPAIRATPSGPTCSRARALMVKKSTATPRRSRVRCPSCYAYGSERIEVTHYDGKGRPLSVSYTHVKPGCPVCAGKGWLDPKPKRA